MPSPRRVSETENEEGLLLVVASAIVPGIAVIVDHQKDKVLRLLARGGDPRRNIAVSKESTGLLQSFVHTNLTVDVIRQEVGVLGHQNISLTIHYISALTLAVLGGCRKLVTTMLTSLGRNRGRTDTYTLPWFWNPTEGLLPINSSAGAIKSVGTLLDILVYFVCSVPDSYVVRSRTLWPMIRLLCRHGIPFSAGNQAFMYSLITHRDATIVLEILETEGCLQKNNPDFANIVLHGGAVHTGELPL
jgi:hypothetical protein